MICDAFRQTTGEVFRATGADASASLEAWLQLSDVARP